jgi:hypothetical protein
MLTFAGSVQAFRFRNTARISAFGPDFGTVVLAVPAAQVSLIFIILS